MAWTFSAWKPLGPLVTENSTAWPSCKLRNPFDRIAEKCTKTSSPDWRLMKPKPLASLNHFTVPCSTLLPVSIVGSEQESGKLCILRGFLKNKEFGLSRC